MLTKVSDCTRGKITHLRSLILLITLGKVYRALSLILADVAEGEKCVVTLQVLVSDAKAAHRAIWVKFCWGLLN